LGTFYRRSGKLVTGNNYCWAWLATFVLSGSGSGRIAHSLSGTIRFRPDSKIYNPVHPYLELAHTGSPGQTAVKRLLLLQESRDRMQRKYWPLSVWVSMRWRRASWDENRFSRCVHEHESSSVCVFPWTFEALLRCESSWVCILLCLFKCDFLINRLLHTVHKYGLGLSSGECSVWSLLSASVFTSQELSPV